MIKCKLFIILLLISGSAIAQDSFLLLNNNQTNKSIIITEGAKLRVRFSGYLGKETFFKGSIIQITDSSLTLQKGEFYEREQLEVLLSDINGLRTYSLSRLITEELTGIAILTGAIILSSALPGMGMPFWLSTLVGIGIDVVGELLMYYVFPNRIKYDLRKDWRLTHIPLN